MVSRLINTSNTNSFFLFGARGTGKSTYLKDTKPYSEGQFVDLLSDRDFRRLERDPDSLSQMFTETNPENRWIIIDEIQRVPELLNNVHKLIEENNLLFGLAGSSARKLKRGGANLLAGRAFVYYLFPLTYQELGEQFVLNDVLSTGSLPKTFSLSQEEKLLYLEAYVDTYLKEEVIAEQLVRSVRPFRRFLDVAGQMSGKIINYSEISRDLGVDPQTVQSYFSILEDTHIGLLLPAWHRSIRKQQRLAPKFYLFDIGVKRVLEHGPRLGEISPGTYEYGNAFEHFIILEMHRLNHYKRLGYKFSYLRTKDDAEIDLVIERGNETLALIEVKSTTNIQTIDTKSLERFQRDIEAKRAMVLSLDPTPQKIGFVEALPWERGFEELGF